MMENQSDGEETPEVKTEITDFSEEVMTRKVLAINLALSQIIMLLCAAVFIIAIGGELSWNRFLMVKGGTYPLAGLITGSAALLSVQLIFEKFVPKEKLEDIINDILVKRFSLAELSLIFFLGALAEELLFRGVIQSLLGIWAASLLFTLIHYRYWRKPFIMIEVFLMSLVLGYIYKITSLLWISVLCHFIVNFTMAFLSKRGSFSGE